MSFGQRKSYDYFCLCLSGGNGNVVVLLSVNTFSTVVVFRVWGDKETHRYFPDLLNNVTPTLLFWEKLWGGLGMLSSIMLSFDECLEMSIIPCCGFSVGWREIIAVNDFQLVCVNINITIFSLEPFNFKKHLSGFNLSFQWVISRHPFRFLFTTTQVWPCE